MWKQIITHLYLPSMWDAKLNVGSRVEKASRFEYNLQLEFKPEKGLETAKICPTRHRTGGPQIYENSSKASVCVCVSVGGNL